MKITVYRNSIFIEPETEDDFKNFDELVHDFRNSRFNFKRDTKGVKVFLQETIIKKDDQRFMAKFF